MSNIFFFNIQLENVLVSDDLPSVVQNDPRVIEAYLGVPADAS